MHRPRHNDRRVGVDDIIAGALVYNNVLTSSLIHTQIAYATVNHELNSHSNNEPPNSQKIFMSNGHDLTPSEREERPNVTDGQGRSVAAESAGSSAEPSLYP